MEVNQCDLRCPKKAMMGIEYKQGQANQSGLLGRLSQSVGVGLRGAGHMAYAAAGCPSRAQSEQTWQPSTQCVTDAQALADSMPTLDRAALTEWENTTLQPIRLHGDSPSSEEK